MKAIPIIVPMLFSSFNFLSPALFTILLMSYAGTTCLGWILEHCGYTFSILIILKPLVKLYSGDLKMVTTVTLHGIGLIWLHNAVLSNIFVSCQNAGRIPPEEGSVASEKIHSEEFITFVNIMPYFWYKIWNHIVSVMNNRFLVLCGCLVGILMPTEKETKINLEQS